MPKLIVDLSRVLYLGPWNETEEHCPMVPIVGAGLDGDIALTIDGGLLRGRVAVVPANVPRSVNAFGGRLAVLVFDPVQLPAQNVDEKATLVALESLSGSTSFAESAWKSLLAAAALPPLQSVSQPVRDAIELITQNHRENFPGAEIAASVGYSLSHLQELFRAQLGLSMRSYRTWSRLRHVAQEMQHSSTLAQAAVDAGFYDASHFTNVFTETFGVLPSEVFTDDLEIHVLASRIHSTGE